MKLPLNPVSWEFDPANNVILAEFRTTTSDDDEDPASFSSDQLYTFEIPVNLKWSVYVGTPDPFPTESGAQP